jgi:hypothetical protein
LPICCLALSNNSEARLATFQEFVNGEVSIREAIVFRRITKSDGALVNQEWWRFGYQNDTWYVQRLTPAVDDSSKLVPLPGNTVCGASVDRLWTVGDKDVHWAARDSAAGSIPDTFGEFSRSLLLSALSLGLPRLTEVLSIEKAPVTWNQTKFTSETASKRDPQGKVLAFGTATGEVVLSPEGTSASAPFASPNCDVAQNPPPGPTPVRFKAVANIVLPVLGTLGSEFVRSCGISRKRLYEPSAK